MIRNSVSRIEDVAALFEAEGFEVIYHTEWHLTISCDHLVLSWWPTKDKWQVWGKIFVTSHKNVLARIAKGGFGIPAAASPSTCNRCGVDIWWVKTDRGKNFACQSDGGGHFDRCQNKKTAPLSGDLQHHGGRHPGTRLSPTTWRSCGSCCHDRRGDHLTEHHRRPSQRGALLCRSRLAGLPAR